MSPLIWTLPKVDGPKVEAWLEQVLNEQDQTKKDKASETYLNLTTTIRSSSEEREATTSGPQNAKDQDQSGAGKPSSGGLVKKKRSNRMRSRGRISDDIPHRRDRRQPQAAAKTKSCARNRTRGHRTFHTAAAQAETSSAVASARV